MLRRISRLTMALAASSFAVALRASPAQDYMLYCMGCHGTQAQGVPGKIPPLAGATYLAPQSAGVARTAARRRGSAAVAPRGSREPCPRCGSEAR